MNYPYFIAEFEVDKYPGMKRIMPISPRGFGKRRTEKEGYNLRELVRQVLGQGVTDPYWDAEFYIVDRPGSQRQKVPAWLLREALNTDMDSAEIIAKLHQR